ncbi:AcrB/AcrD/AcrF family protein [bacterium (Candidatus Blackallbacteria) CG17_big_fil_post_rev_8_21_14_2_50_48_46]|uniref:AcrB/AcrD/AcrF family protein n=1 Tax=bacterium (Candidatus Blackallbacteria) CG17_big_fil_post_rev_8_21_14_2_50_48_46 TaxID=2014261 RepID=A0A2M7G6V7_9BACT|nr:MAG: acriflavine resistance protein B [bacterium (Candidatus Blackallbacteria) CG18_big_fil_WC_8_21_14_2_50_49_26]PIW17765.1 MAG: AcrB/AcrD/AcrF family protein [bacterium (Candidatus Blackallbacteria) CG17_big_fil_post_rev_8_21_14_2_50_48_46]PIW47324.1 MAG: AcrB/AcrD/AcrF family protein [bacterium (Candidatus Blackallbacteria) CG13_big_fil_rev_8_21_14_2_50_49_14]
MKTEEKASVWNLPAWSIRHPYLVISFYLAILLACGIALTQVLPRRMMPYIESPILGIVTEAPGLSALEIEQYYSKPIEERMTVIPKVRYIRSSSQEGFSIVSLEFPYGTNMQKALTDVQALMQVVQADLPGTGANRKPSWVVPIDPLNIPVLTVAIRAPDWNAVALREFAENEMVNRLKRLPDIQSVYPYGGKKRQMQIVLDRHKLAAAQLSAPELKAILDRNNLSLSGGRINTPTHETPIRIQNHVSRPEDLLKLPIKGQGEQMLTLADLAEVKDTAREQRSAFHFLKNGQRYEDAVALQIVQNPAASSPKVIAAVEKELKLMQQEYPSLRFETAYDNAHFVNILMENMGEELILGILLTALAVFFFLHGNLQATGIAILTLPISLAFSILVMVPMGMSLNSSTLIGFLVAIGRLVDDAIIDIHAIQKHLRLGKNVREATIDGISEVRLSVAASTLVLIVGLLPLLFCGGIVQIMFEGLVWPIVTGVSISFLVSMTLTAVLADKLLKPEPETPSRHPVYRYGVYPFDRFLNGLEKRYAVWIAWLLKHRFSNLIRVLATLVIGFGFFFFIGGEMMPLADVGQAYGVLETQPGTSFERTEQIVRAFEEILAEYPEIEKASVELGAEPGGTFFTGYAMNRVNGASIMLTFSDKDTRQRSIWQIMDEVQERALATVPGIRRLQIKEMGSDVMASSQAPISILVTGKDLKIIDQLTREVAEIAKKTEGLYQVGTSWTLGVPTWELTPDLRRLQEVGISLKDLGEQLDSLLRGSLSEEDFYLSNQRQDTLQLRLQADQRRSLGDLENLEISTPSGPVPLKSLARLAPSQTPTLIEHDGIRRSNTVLAYYRPGEKPSMDASMEVLMKAMGQLNWPPGYGIEMRGDMTQMMDSFARLFQGLALSLLLIFLILVAQFKGFLQPLQMVFSLPLELSGVFLALFLAHQAFSSVSIMAVIVLTGMDITTAILLIDHILRTRQTGLPRDQAVIQACPERLRPILMTSLITIAVMTRIALAPPTGLDAYSPLATVVIGGLLAGTLLSLWDIPMMHTLVDDLHSRWQRRKS